LNVVSLYELPVFAQDGRPLHLVVAQSLSCAIAEPPPISQHCRFDLNYMLYPPTFAVVRYVSGKTFP
jgi:hypothetical protein